MSIRNDIITGLLNSLNTLRTSASYSDSNIRTVQAYRSNYAEYFSSQTPALMVVDMGNDSPVVRDESQTRFAFDVELWGYVARKEWPQTLEEMNGIVADVKKWVNSAPSIHAQILAINFVEAYQYQYDPKALQGLVGVVLNLIYYVDNGTY